MIAIPVDVNTAGIKSSKLFGNAKMFAIYSKTNSEISIIKNDAAGGGIETAKFLKAQGVKEVAYSFMGKGLFDELDKDGVNVFYLGKEPIMVHKIIKNISKGDYIKVEQSNAQTYLDPGTSSANCECGGSHE
ncbi:MAG: NifB/NifX family molybdenum-iron cluster-binding protein [Campylobacterota bacterium]|nr:NifB/NifX family molybdenum-iron cluster-binding protein [Campylobacterota bacterium]